jgi:hypothetical protein
MMHPAEISETRRKLVLAGYKILPAAGKAIHLPGWSGFSACLEDVSQWEEKRPRDTNTGALTANTPTVDIDIMIEDAADAVEDLLRQRFGTRGTFLIRSGMKPKRAVPFRTSAPFEKIAVTFAAMDGGKDPKIEILGKGQQFIVHGIHPDTREPYTWSGGELWNTAHEKLPTISEREARDFINDAAKMLVDHFGFKVKVAVKDHDHTDDRQSSEPNADIETLRRALDVIPNNFDWDGWNNVGMALWRATNGTGFTLFDAWSQGAPNYNAANTSAKWNAYFRSPPTSIGAGTIFRLANQFSPNWRYGFFSGAYTESPSIDPEEEQQQRGQKSEPLPLYPQPPPAEPYPVDALGVILARAAYAVSRKIQVPEAIAAQSVLSAACLAAQAVADVRLPFGQVRPLSCYFVTVAQTGDRKTSADSEASSAIRKRETDLRETFKKDIVEHKARLAAYLAVKKGIENAKGQTVEQKMRDIVALGPEPQPPLSPFLTAPDPTIEGLLKAWKNAPASLGLFSAEGGQFVGGHGMTDEAKLRTAAALSELWDGVPPKRIRAGDGVSILPGRRLALHMLVQPEASAVFLSDRALKDQGLLSRVLSAAPESIAGTRFYKAPQASDDAAIRDFERVVLNILSGQWPLVGSYAGDWVMRSIRRRGERAFQ